MKNLEVIFKKGIYIFVEADNFTIKGSFIHFIVDDKKTVSVVQRDVLSIIEWYLDNELNRVEKILYQGEKE